MATTGVLSTDDSQTDIDDKQLELFCRVWLDANENIMETRNAEQKLSLIINHLKKFQDIEHRTQKDRLVLIVSGEMRREIVPFIHTLRQVYRIK